MRFGLHSVSLHTCSGPATADAYAATGVGRLILCPQPTLNHAGLTQFITTTAQTLSLQP